ncbi:CNPV142 N1R/p28-like protein [Canarypox virus]|uniref:CNPV142 N1R/p28-like protein n=1 Tax=Canarypox virus TaxID=44088 RepID=Q6VZK5_CNPV|nr:CNPV142 N1R/p28-like protein [Canarypox virus]AAR83488.1 CNPV142 N1R/p28-like protein [Canarypox virus]AWD84618.1 N1R/p28-like protein [Canarypox virus]
MELSYIVTRDINEQFCYARYYDFDVIVLKDNGFINATKLCELGKKDFKNWLCLDGSKELIEKIKEHNNYYYRTNLTSKNMLCVILEIKNTHKYHKHDVSGSYIHPDLVPHIVSWISPSFAVRVSKITNYHISGHYEYKLIKRKKEIKEIYEMLFNFSIRHNANSAKLRKELKAMEEKYTRDINELKVRLIELKAQNKELKTELIKIEYMLKDKTVTYHHHIRFRHLVILQNKKDSNSFKVLFIYRERLTNELNKIKNDYRIFYSAYDPNAVSCFNQLKDKLLDLNLIKFCYNDFMLVDTEVYCTKKFIEDLKSMNIIRKYA